MGTIALKTTGGFTSVAQSIFISSNKEVKAAPLSFYLAESFIGVCLVLNFLASLK